MSFDCALAHKLAAWNERRLLRDLYDVYFLAVRLDQSPDLAVLDRRLARIESRRPELRGRAKMSRGDLAAALTAAAQRLTESAVRDELGPLLPAAELAGLSLRLRAATLRLADTLARR